MGKLRQTGLVPQSILLTVANMAALGGIQHLKRLLPAVPQRGADSPRESQKDARRLAAVLSFAQGCSFHGADRTVQLGSEILRILGQRL